MDELDDIVREFLTESRENLDRLDNELLVLESTPDDRDTLSSIFRTIHTIKGTCGFLGFSRLEEVAHVGENLLSKLRDGEIRLNAERTSALLAMVDAVRAMLGTIERSGNDGVEDYAGLTARIAQLQSDAPGAAPAAKAAPGVKAGTIGEILVKQRAATAEQVASALIRQGEGDPRHVGEILVQEAAVPPKAAVEALKTQQQEGASCCSSASARSPPRRPRRCC